MTIESMGETPFLIIAMKEWVSDNDMVCPECGCVHLALRHGTNNGVENAQIVCVNCKLSSKICESEADMIGALEFFTEGDTSNRDAWDEFMDDIMDNTPLANVIEEDVIESSPMACNDNIVALMNEDDLTEEEIIEDVAEAFEGVLDALRIDTEHDHNTRDTAMRVAKMYVKEIFKGRYQEMPKVTSFPNAKEYDQIYTVDEIEIRSTCAHHFQPIVGRAWVAIYPGDKVIGLSKFARIIDWIASRPTIQEELVEQIADTLEEVTGARGVMVVVKAEHGCCTNRGIKAHSSNMTTSVVRGEFRENKDMKAEAIAMFQNFG